MQIDKHKQNLTTQCKLTSTNTTSMQATNMLEERPIRYASRGVDDSNSQHDIIIIWDALSRRKASEQSNSQKSNKNDNGHSTNGNQLARVYNHRAPTQHVDPDQPKSIT